MANILMPDSVAGSQLVRHLIRTAQAEQHWRRLGAVAIGYCCYFVIALLLHLPHRHKPSTWRAKSFNMCTIKCGTCIHMLTVIENVQHATKGG